MGGTSDQIYYRQRGRSWRYRAEYFFYGAGCSAFKAQWRDKFDKRATTVQNFYGVGGKVRYRCDIR